MVVCIGTVNAGKVCMGNWEKVYIMPVVCLMHLASIGTLLHGQVLAHSAKWQGFRSSPVHRFTHLQ
jgi:hypothetical protein